MKRGVRTLSKEKQSKPVAPIYAVAAIWLLFSAWKPIYSAGRLAWAVVLSVIGYAVVKSIVGDKDKAKTPKEKTDEPEETVLQATKKDEPTYSPEVQAVVDEGKKAREELQRLYYSIPDLAVKKKVQEIMDVSDKIVRDAVDDPGDVPQIKKFLDYYLPTTIKLLNAYDRMGAQGIEGENIGKTMNSINEMLDTAITAYKKLLDNLFANQAMDIETDIDVMNTLLKREGFAASDGGGLKL